MKNCKSLLALFLTFMLIFTSFSIIGTTSASAATYTKIPALQITRVYQPDYDTSGMCYWASMATVQGYCLGTYTYGGVTTNYRVPGKDYDFLKRSDAITKYFDDHADGYANSANNLKNNPVKMTRVTSGIGKNAATYQKIYDQLAQGKPVIIYTGTHASVVIAYNGSTTTLEPNGFTVLEVKKDGKWWSNSESYYNKHANSPQVDSNKGSYMSCYVNLESWISYCGNKVQEICYPTNAVSTAYTFAFSANGGTGTMSSIKTDMGKTVTFPQCAFTYDGYTCEGYYAQRKSDSKWHVAGVGWRTLQEIIDNNLQRSVYAEGLTFEMNFSWTKDGGIAGDTFTLVPVWKPLKTKLEFYGNYSAVNYMMSIKPETYSEYYQSRNTSVYTLSTEKNADNTILKITGSEAGGNGKDLLFKTQTNKGINYNNHSGDNKNMQLTFKAKASVDGAKMYFRWGYTTDLTSVTLTTQWQEYTIDMNKQPNDGAHMHPYFDTAGTFYISDMVLREANASNPTIEETSDLLYTYEYQTGTTYGELPVPQRAGYTFMGWYTSKFGGAKLTKTTVVLDSHTAVYARWEKANDNTGKILFGDTDLSGSINVKDATMIQKGIAGIVELSQKQTFAGNVVESDALNIKDATAIQKWCAGINTGILKLNTMVSYTA